MGNPIPAWIFTVGARPASNPDTMKARADGGAPSGRQMATTAPSQSRAWSGSAKNVWVYGQAIVPRPKISAAASAGPCLAMRRPAW